MNRFLTDGSRGRDGYFVDCQDGVVNGFNQLSTAAFLPGLLVNVFSRPRAVV